jgi:hypothetical protein
MLRVCDFLLSSDGVDLTHEGEAPAPLSAPWTGAHGPEFPVGFNGFHKLHAPFLKERRTRGRIQGSLQEIRGVCAGISGALHGLTRWGEAPFRCSRSHAAKPMAATWETQ